MKKTYDTLLIVFFAFVLSALVYLIVGFALSQADWKRVLASENLSNMLFLLFSAVSVITVVFAARIRASIFSEGTPRPQNGEDLRRTIVSKSILSFALSEVPAILGLVLFLLSSEFIYLVALCVVSIVSFLLIKPSRQAFEDLERQITETQNSLKNF